jgi:hypothetical protein
MTKSLNPFKVYKIWIALFFIYCLVTAFLSSGHNGGEERLLVLLGHGLNYFIEGLFIISITTSFLCKTWFKKYWPVNVLLLVITSVIIITVAIQNDGFSSLF